MNREIVPLSVRVGSVDRVEKSIQQNRLYIIGFILFLLLFLVPEMASANPLENLLKGLTKWVTSGVGIALASVVLIAIGIMWMFNKIHIGWLIGYCVGLAFVLGSEKIVNIIKGWTG